MTGDYQLTRNFVAAVDASTTETDPAMLHPILQVLNVKSVDSSKAIDNAKRYRLVMSDGGHYIQAMMATQLNTMLDNEEVGHNSIVRLNRYICNSVPNKPTKLLIILELEVIAHVSKRIGNPVAFYATDHTVEAAGQNNQHRLNAPQTYQKPPQQQLYPSNKNQQYNNVNNNQFYNNTSYNQNSNNTNQNAASASTYNNNMAGGGNQPLAPSMPLSQQIFPIRSLSPYQNKWTIRVRCMGKSDIRHFKTQKSEGRLFSITFFDESGEIRATAFGDAVSQFYDVLQDNGTYLISKGVIKTANEKFNNTNNEYEMTMDSNTMVTVCNDAVAAPQLKIDPVSLSELYALESNASIDVLGVVKETGDLNSITTKAGRPANKRDLMIVDRSGYQVRLTLWGRQAETFEGSDHPVIAVKGCKVGDFQGRSLSALSTSSILINPDNPEAHGLKGWFERDAGTTNFQQYSNNGPTGGAIGAGKPSLNKVVAAIKDENLGTSEKPDYVSTKATITHIKRDNLSYPACPACNKKMMEDSGSWRCEKCDKMYPQPTHRYLLNVSLSDHTGVIWATAFNEHAEQILGHKANELAQIKQDDENQFNSIMDDAMFRSFAWTFRCKQETFNDENKVRITVQSITPIEYHSRIQELKETIAQYQRMG